MNEAQAFTCVVDERDEDAAVAAATCAVVLGALDRIRGHPKWDAERSCIILSGGLDTCIIAEAGSQVLGLREAVTVLATAGKPRCLKQ